ncbi:MAG: cytochrome c, partial [Nitrospira sp.]|nr:cytochrome c [Nitrospira sp.]
LTLRRMKGFPAVRFQRQWHIARTRADGGNQAMGPRGAGLALIIIGMAAAGFASRPSVKELSSSGKGDPVAGREIYVNTCIRCHGVDGKGSRDVALMPPPADLTSAAVQNRLDAALFKRIHGGKPNTAMGAWHHALSDEEIWDVVAYVREIGTNADPHSRE